MSSESPPTLASLRRRGTPRRPPRSQPDLFPSLFELADSSATTESRNSERLSQPGSPPHSSSSDVAEVLDYVPAVAVPQAMLPEVVTQVDPILRVSDPPPTFAADPEPAAVPRTWTVSGLVRHVRGLVERGYGQITVEGEISNWRPAGSGHCYFTVKDTGAQLSAVLFRRQASLLRFRPTDGDAVRLHGQPSL